jgi:hypothetical protein
VVTAAILAGSRVDADSAAAQVLSGLQPLDGGEQGKLVRGLRGLVDRRDGRQQAGGQRADPGALAVLLADLC